MRPSAIAAPPSGPSWLYTRLRGGCLEVSGEPRQWALTQKRTLLAGGALELRNHHLFEDCSNRRGALVSDVVGPETASEGVGATVRESACQWALTQKRTLGAAAHLSNVSAAAEGSSLPSTIAPGTLTPLAFRLSSVMLFSRSEASGIPQKSVILACSNTTLASWSAALPVMLFSATLHHQGTEQWYEKHREGLGSGEIREVGSHRVFPFLSAGRWHETGSREVGGLLERLQRRAALETLCDRGSSFGTELAAPQAAKGRRGGVSMGADTNLVRERWAAYLSDCSVELPLRPSAIAAPPSGPSSLCPPRLRGWCLEVSGEPCQWALTQKRTL